MKSNKPKNTPGPWVVHEWRREHRTANGENQPRFQYQVTTIDGSPIETSTKNKANAALIAAAPEMLEALETVLNLYKSTGMSPEEHEVNRLVWNAVNKARGES